MTKSETKKKRRFLKPIVAISLAAAVITGALFLFAGHSYGAFNAEKAVLFSVYKSQNTIENGTLFIGTWLIHKDALTDDYYEQAKSSAVDSGQEVKYYKSELANGSWFDISSAESLADISGSATPVEESVLDPLYVEFVVGKDGQVQDANGAEVNPFNNPDPYDLRRLEELRPIWFQYALEDSTEKNVTESSYLADHNSEAKGRVEADKYIFSRVNSFWGSNVRTDETNRIDAAINALYQLTLDLKADGREDDAATVSKLCEKLDHRRRAIVFDLLSVQDDNHLSNLYEGASGARLSAKAPSSSEGEDEEKPDDDEAFVPDQAMLEAIQDSMKNCTESYGKHSGSELTDSDTILGHLEYQYSQGIIDNAGTPAVNDYVNRLSYIYAIEDSQIKNKDGELLELDSNLIPPAENGYRTSVLSGVPESYTQAIESQGTSSARASSILDEQEKNAESMRAQLQFFIKEKTDRQTPADGLKFTNERITWTNDLISGVADDAFHSRAVNSLNAHLKWLRDLAEAIKNGDDSLKSDLDALVEEKNDLLKEKLSCLDNNDLAGAARIDSMLSVIDDKIKDEQKKLSAAGGAGGAGGVGGAGGAGGNDAKSVADKLLSDALGSIGEEGADSDSLKNIMSALGGIGATDQLNDLKNALSDAGANAGTMNALDNALSDAKDSNLMKAATGGSGYDIAGMSDEDLLKLLMSLFGKSSWNELSDAEKAILAAVLSKLGDNGYQNCARLAGVIGSTLYNEEHNKYIYLKYKGQSGGVSQDPDSTGATKWVSLKAVGDITDYRYVYNDTKQQSILTGPGNVYNLYVGDEFMYTGQNENSKTITLLNTPVLQSGIMYADLNTSVSYFEVNCYYLGASDYAAAIPASLEPRVTEMFNTLTGKS